MVLWSRSCPGWAFLARGQDLSQPQVPVLAVLLLLLIPVPAELRKSCNLPRVWWPQEGHGRASWLGAGLAVWTKSFVPSDFFWCTLWERALEDIGFSIWHNKTPFSPLLDYLGVKCFWMQMRASHTPCPAWRSSKVTWPPGSAPTAAIHWPVQGWLGWQQPGQWLNAKSRALKTLQQQFW